MAYPPVIPPATRANSTTQLDNHPGDHNALSAALNAMPWGRVASVRNTGGAQSGIGSTSTDLTGMSLTFTRLAGRVYHGVYGLTWNQLTANATANISLLDGANNLLENPGAMVVATGYMSLSYWFALAAGTGPLTLKLRGSTGGGTITVLHAPLNPTALAVFDVGPV